MSGCTLVSLSLHCPPGCEIVLRCQHPVFVEKVTGRNRVNSPIAEGASCKVREINFWCTGTTGSLTFALTKFRRYAGVSALSQGAHSEGRISGSPRLKQEKRSWGLFFVSRYGQVSETKRASMVEHTSSERVGDLCVTGSERLSTILRRTLVLAIALRMVGRRFRGCNSYLTAEILEFR